MPEATNRGTNGLAVEVVPVHTAIEIVQEADPGVDGVVDIGSTPEESVASNTAETTIASAKTTWESRKTTFIRCSGI